MEFFESEGKIVKTETTEKKLVGRIGNNYYFCDTIFEYENGLKGATATVLCPVSREIYEQRTDPTDSDTLDWFEECWKGAVQTGHTTKGLEAWAEEVLAVDGDEAVFDFSGYDYWDDLRNAVPELTEEDYPVFECVGGGRSFRPNMQWDEIYNEELWNRIKEIEAN